MTSEQPKQQSRDTICDVSPTGRIASKFGLSGLHAQNNYALRYQQRWGIQKERSAISTHVHSIINLSDNKNCAPSFRLNIKRNVGELASCLPRLIELKTFGNTDPQYQRDCVARARHCLYTRTKQTNFFCKLFNYHHQLCL